MDKSALIITNQYFGNTPVELSDKLSVSYFDLLLDQEVLPPFVLVYGNGVLALHSPIFLKYYDLIRKRGTHFIFCKTCITFFDIDQSLFHQQDIGTMKDILETQTQVDKLIYLY